MDLVRTKVKTNFLYVEIDENISNDLDTFVIHTLTAHKIEPKEYDVTVYDQFRTPINKEIFPRLMKKFANCSDFFIEIDYKLVEADKPIPTEIFQKLKCFILETKIGEIAIEEENKNKALTPRLRQKVVSLVCDFIQETFGLEAESKLIKMTCVELIEMFPSLKYEQSKIGGIDLLYNQAKSSGFVLNVLSYRRKKRKSSLSEKNSGNIDYNNNNDIDENDVAESLQNLDISDENFSEDQIEQFMVYFRNCVVSKEKPLLIDRLQQTKKLRNSILKIDKKDIMEIFPFYFTSPDLILTDFTIRFDQIDHDSLFKKWPLMSQRIDESNKDVFEIFNDNIDRNINRILFLFARMPPRRVQISNSIKSLIVFNKDATTDPLKMISRKNNSVYIICIGSSTSSVQYYIHIKDHLIPVPKEFSFLQTFDIFFKTFKVFLVEYHPHIFSFMTFFGFYVYGTDEIQPQHSARLLEVKNLVFRTDLVINSQDIETQHGTEWNSQPLIDLSES